MSYISYNPSAKVRKLVVSIDRHTSKDYYVTGECLELLTHSAEHHVPHGIIRDEEARMDVSLVLLDAARHKRNEHEVAVYGGLGSTIRIIEVCVRTGEHVCQLEAPTKCDDDLPP